MSETSRTDSLVLCEHCNELITTKTYKRHRKLYYNTETEEWVTAESIKYKKPKISTGWLAATVPNESTSGMTLYRAIRIYYPNM